MSGAHRKDPHLLQARQEAVVGRQQQELLVLAALVELVLSTHRANLVRVPLVLLVAVVEVEGQHQRQRLRRERERHTEQRGRGRGRRRRRGERDRGTETGRELLSCRPTK